jgi:uncharacterized DUF497 family protein
VSTFRGSLQAKAAANARKHGVTFQEAATAFEDPLYVDFYDPDHSADEHRFLMLGRTAAGRLLLVSYTDRGERLRLISAREATAKERKTYAGT